MAKQVQLDANGKRKFSIRDSVAYAAGDLGCNMSFALKGTMALFWTQVMGLSLWYSLLLVIVQVWDAINDRLSVLLSTPTDVIIREISFSLTYGSALSDLSLEARFASFRSPALPCGQRLLSLSPAT